MNKNIFKLRVKEIAYGWCRVNMLINDKEISYCASYLGINPLESFIDACADFISLDTDGEYYCTWYDEPGSLHIELKMEEHNLRMDIKQCADESDNEVVKEWHEVIPYDCFVNEVISEGFRVLRAFGLYGYRCSWQNQTDFPLASLLRITKKCYRVWNGDSCYSDISKEIECLQEFLPKTSSIGQAIKMDECVVYYESWQIQCCGDPFAVGDTVEWTCVYPSLTKHAHGILIDCDEEHHVGDTHKVRGTISKIIVERSEFPIGKREVWYESAGVIHEEVQKADGWESELKDDETTERTFWGYIVTLKDAEITPIDKSKLPPNPD